KPDVVFLDIEMPELDGFGVAEAIKGNGPRGIFITAYNDHALRAFEVNAIDYLVKPIVDARLAEPVEKVRRRGSQQTAEDYTKLLEAVAGQNAVRRLAVRCGSKFVVLDPVRISAVIARDHYSAIMIDGREWLADDPLDVLIRRLNGK